MPPDPTILAFDTSAAHCAAALLSGGQIVAAAEEAMVKGQAERLMGLLEELLATAGTTWRDLDAVGVGTGPGNFTGTRISIAAARGLALALGVPAIGVTALKAQAHDTPGLVVSSRAAPRDGLYIQVLGDLQGHQPRQCTLDDLPDIPARAEPACIGHRAGEIAALCAGHVAAPARPLAEAIARIAAARIGGDNPRPAPLYLRPPDAAPPRDAAPVLLL